VNTFSYYQWRAISMLKRARILLEDLSKSQMRHLSYAQLPNGKTLLHALKRNQDSIAYLFETVHDPQVDKVPFYVPVLED
jgi:hypothetical protein